MFVVSEKSSPRKQQTNSFSLLHFQLHPVALEFSMHIKLSQRRLSQCQVLLFFCFDKSFFHVVCTFTVWLKFSFEFHFPTTLSIIGNRASCFLSTNPSLFMENHFKTTFVNIKMNFFVTMPIPPKKYYHNNSGHNE